MTLFRTYRPWFAVILVLALSSIAFRPGLGITFDRDPIAHIPTLAKEFESQIQLVGEEHALGAAFGKAGETWASAALTVAEKTNNAKARTFLTQALEKYHGGIAKAGQDQESVQLLGINLLYQSVDTLAILLAETNQDKAALQVINQTEKRLFEVVRQGRSGGPALAGITGGVMTMLAVIADQVDTDKKMADIRANEFDRRRNVDANIAAGKDLTTEQRILLLTNNHLQGAFSMAQIITLIKAPDKKPQLKEIEEQLIQSAQNDVTGQILAAATALTKTGFLAASAIISSP
jgi:hypothetical protein